MDRPKIINPDTGKSVYMDTPTGKKVLQKYPELYKDHRTLNEIAYTTISSGNEIADCNILINNRQNKINLISDKVFTKTSIKTVIINIFEKLIYKISQSTKDTDSFRKRSFKKACIAINNIENPETINDFRNIKDIGPGILRRISEIIETGTLKELDDGDGEGNNDNENIKLINELITIIGIGKSHAKKFIELGVTSIDDLEHKIVVDKSIKTTHQIEVGLKYRHDMEQKIPRSELFDIEKHLKDSIFKLDKNIIMVICGSYRRGLAQSSDIDMLITVKPEYYDNKYPYLTNVVQMLIDEKFIIDSLTTLGNTKYMGLCKIYNYARRIDIRYVDYSSFYYAQLYFTGSVEFNRIMRSYALSVDYTLNEYGLYKLSDKEKVNNIQVNSETDIFDYLGLVYNSPENRCI